MEEKIVTNSLKTVKTYKFKISYDNGANETIIPSGPPSLDQQIPMFMNFVIKQGFIRQVNLNKIRNMEVEITESREANLIL